MSFRRSAVYATSAVARGAIGDSVRDAWVARGYTAAEVEVLVREGFSLHEPPTAKERVAVLTIASRRWPR